ncbi:MAG: hypothetical protein RIC95_13755 [Vicingaceae bacterium]
MQRQLFYGFSFLILLSGVLFSCDKNEEFESEEEAQQNFVLQGTGTLVFNDYQPFSDKAINLYYHVPESANKTSPILMVFHGASRDAVESRDELIKKADFYNTILVVPEFSNASFPGSDTYNLGNVFVDGDNPSPQTLNPETEWTFSVIEPIYDYIKGLTANQNNTYRAFGFSAGAQFLHRFLLFKPNAKVGRVVVASAGWYSIPDLQIDFPYGIQKTPIQSSSLGTFFSRDLTVLVGEADNDPNAPSLRRNSSADQQGTNRLARAQYFFNQSSSLASQSGISFQWNYKSIPNARHNFKQVGEYAFDNILSQ